ncbi:hypothetical protein EW146_g10379, partial [Bondarzewia mesenterica]
MHPSAEPTSEQTSGRTRPLFEKLEIDDVLLNITFWEDMLEEVAQAPTSRAKRVVERHFPKMMELLLTALDVVGQVHPVAQPAVVAFRTVFSLMNSLKENQHKILILFIAMKDMMVPLLHLKHDRGTQPGIVAERIAETRIAETGSAAAKEIYDCFRHCDTYLKLDPFVRYRSTFKFIINSRMDRNISEVAGTVHELNNRMSEILAKLDSPEHERFKETIGAAGGPEAYRNNDGALRSLIAEWTKASTSKSDNPVTFEDLKKILFEDIQTSIERNSIYVKGKLELQSQQLSQIHSQAMTLTVAVQKQTEAMVDAMRGTASEIIDYVRLTSCSSPIFTLKNPCIPPGYSEDMGKNALRDHFHDQVLNDHRHAVGRHHSIDSSGHPDAWAIKYIDIKRLQPIMEAFDDDASGFITVVEVNQFTSSPTRPPKWTLPHWVAFWAIGWKASMMYYKDEIRRLLSRMDSLRPDILPVNRQSVDKYYGTVWTSLYPLIATASLSDTNYSAHQDKFEDFVHSEEARLHTNLNRLQYIIDGPETLPLVTGPGRIENTLFPLLYLLINHHYKILREARKRVIRQDLLTDGVQSVNNV